MAAIMTVKGLTKKYRLGQEVITAVNNIDLEIHEGEFLCILGTSGSGKTTLLHLLAGLERPTRGQIILKDSMVLSKMKEKDMALFRRKYIGFIFQSYNLMPTLTALENVTLPLVFDGVSLKERNRKGRDLLIQLGLKDRIFHKPTEMSGGQQQRVSIARALVSDPKILFCDEPTGNLDTKNTKEIIEILHDLAAERGVTVVMVTHDLNLVPYADRTIHMVDGKIIKIEEKGA